ncbi:hypothetical protein KP509_24G071300 [Ceratopteris richardii]|nr:hypothetical protein KP509_24G071300 [Ceratopteris richardii]
MMWQTEPSKGETSEVTLLVSSCTTQMSGSPILNNNVNPWKLCTVTQVEEVKLIVRIFPIWLSTIVYGLMITQAATFFIQQASTMDRNVGSLFIFPSGSLLAFSSAGILICLPIYARVLIPCARWFTGYERGLTMLQRLGAGFFLSILCMVTAALVERRRLEIAEEYGLLDDPTATVPMSVFWLVPQYFIFGMSDVFALVGEQEFFYDQVPDSMRSLGMALFLCGNGLASYLGNAVISIVGVVTSRGNNTGWIANNLNRSHLDYFYWLLAVILAVNFVVYLFLCRCYIYKSVVH